MDKEVNLRNSDGSNKSHNQIVQKKNRKKRKNKKNKVKKVFKILRNCIIFVLLIMFVFVFYSLYHLEKVNDNSVVLSSTMPKDNNFINILAMGVDIGDPNSNNPNDPKRTDTMILVNYNKSQRRLSLISIPRDTLVTINNKNQKINYAHACDGPKLAVEKVEELLGIRIDYYGKVNYKGFRALIDAIGGIDMEIKYNMKYDDDGQNLHIDFKKGRIEHLNGEKAEKFFRWRKNNDGSGFVDGDIGRIKNQQEFMQVVMKKLKSPSIVFKLPKIISTIPKFVETNMSSVDILSFGTKLIGLKRENIVLKTLGGEGKYINKISYFIYDKNSSQDILKLIKQTNYIDIDKNNLKINILNETNKAGLAKNLKDHIEGKGYKNISTGNKTGEDKTKIIFKGVSKDKIDVIMDDFKIYNKEVIEEKANDNEKKEDFNITVLLGYDHDYINE